MVHKIQTQALPDHKMYLSPFQTRSIFFELRSCGFSWLRDPIEGLYGQTNMTCDCITSPRTNKSDSTVFSIICCVPAILACCECVIFIIKAVFTFEDSTLFSVYIICVLASFILLCC